MWNKRTGLPVIGRADKSYRLRRPGNVLVIICSLLIQHDENFLYF